MSLRIKICGITRVEDAMTAVEAGADALGFMFYEGSPRRISPDQARAIIHSIPPFVARVGVFVNASLQDVLKTASICGLDTLQFHGDESPAFCQDPSLAGFKRLKAFRVRDRETLAALPSHAGAVDAFLLDSYTPNQLGGTGERFNWDLAVEAKSAGRPVVLAGGLAPENIAQAVEQVAPFGVDVSSGVESGPGIKDADKLHRFVHQARQAAGRFLP